jgi:tyrosyl-tRNA synthetase
MQLSEELAWRGFVNQTTFDDPTILDGKPLTFYWGVDPSADSMHVGQLAMALMIRKFIEHGHNAILLVGGATGLIGDPDGKRDERSLKSKQEVARNKQAIAAQYQKLFQGQSLQVVDNYDWFKDINYLAFLRDIGKHVPMRQMLGREFIQTRLALDGAGISYAEFSYVLIQAYDFLHLYKDKGATLQVCGADQWGNSIAGVELIRRIEGADAHVWSAPLIINTATGKKFGKSEAGTVWLDPKKTSPTSFYQFWINLPDEGIDSYLKLYTQFSKVEISEILAKHVKNPASRLAQKTLADAVTALVHGQDQAEIAKKVTNFLTGSLDVSEADPASLRALREEIPSGFSAPDGNIIDALVAGKLARSKTEARRLLQAGAVFVNGQKIDRENFLPEDFQDNVLLVRKGKKYRDSALIELQTP